MTRVPPLLDGFDRVAPVARAVLTGLGHRGELAVLEAGEARDHLLRSLGLATAALVAVQLAGLGLMFAIAAAVWHREDRALLLGLLAAAQVALATGLGWILVRRLRRWSPWAEVRRQLRADGDCLGALLHGKDDVERPG